MPTRRNTRSRKPTHRSRNSRRKSRRSQKRNTIRNRRSHRGRRGGSRTPTPINTPLPDEIIWVHTVMNAILTDVRNRYADGWRWNVGTSGWLRDGGEIDEFPDIIRDVLRGDVEMAARSIDAIHARENISPADIVNTRVNTRLPYEITPLMFAIFLHNSPMVMFLLNNGANVTDTIHIMPNDERNNTVLTSVLDLAELVGTPEIVATLNYM